MKNKFMLWSLQKLGSLAMIGLKEHIGPVVRDKVVPVIKEDVVPLLREAVKEAVKAEIQAQINSLNKN